MATAEAYDQWDDPGLAFTDEQCAEYDPKAVAAVRVNELLGLVPLAIRRSQLGEKAKWWETVAAKMTDVITWYCVVGGLPGIDRAALHAQAEMVDKKALTQLTVIARQLGEPEEFLAVWQASVRSEMVQHVTLGRRCAGSRKLSGWTKAERSLSNKIANAIVKEMSVAQKMADALAARTKGNSEES
jgi:hypothetical protein